VTKSRLLIVEDDDRIRSSLRLALGDEGYLVETIEDAEQGLERFNADPHDLVLVDVTRRRAGRAQLVRRRLSHRRHRW